MILKRQRREVAVCRARESLLQAMQEHSLTPMEWLKVIAGLEQWLIHEGLKEEWSEPESRTEHGQNGGQ